MKRCASAIVDYGSSSDEDSPKNTPPPKKKKLPTLPAALVVPVPVDNIALHQGRTRTVPHVDGNWAAHIYLSIIVNKSHAMYSLLEATIAEAQWSLPALQSLRPSKDAGEHYVELHISLSRPVFIRAHQKEELRRAVRKIAQRPLFKVSFSSFAELQNDEGTRTFLTTEIGAGHHELHQLCTDLRPVLQSLRQPSYYSTPRFHASIAWALLDRVQKPADAEGNLMTQESSPNPNVPSDIDPESTSSAGSQTSVEFATVPGIPEELIVRLNSKFGEGLSSPRVGAFDAEGISLKIGKDIISWPFIGG